MGGFWQRQRCAGAGPPRRAPRAPLRPGAGGRSAPLRPRQLRRGVLGGRLGAAAGLLRGGSERAAERGLRLRRGEAELRAPRRAEQVSVVPAPLQAELPSAWGGVRRRAALPAGLCP